MANVTGATTSHSLYRKATVTQGNAFWSEEKQFNLDTTEWTVLASGTVTALGAHSLASSLCPSNLIKLTCGAIGTSSVLSAITSGLTAQIECPEYCAALPYKVFGSSNLYSSDSSVCVAALHANASGVIVGMEIQANDQQVNAGISAASVARALLSSTITTASLTVDVVLVCDASSSMSTTLFNQVQGWAESLVRSFLVEEGGRFVRIAIIQYTNVATTLFSLSRNPNVASLLAAVQPPTFVRGASSTRSLSAGLTTANTMIRSTGRSSAARVVRLSSRFCRSVSCGCSI